MSKITIGIVEDEAIIAENICDVLEELGYRILEPVSTYTEALEMFEIEKPDLILIDIQLAGKKDGIDLALKINELYQIPFIFLTSNADKMTVDRAKLARPNAYLVKPFNKEEIYTSIEIALFNHDENKKLDEFHKKDSILIKHKQLFLKIKFDDILFLKSDHIYVEIHTKDSEKFLVRDSLSKYLEVLSRQFVRVHRRFIVNTNYVKTIENESLYVNEHEIPLAKLYKKELLDKMNLM